MTAPVPDNAAVIDFLKMAYRNGPWHVSVIHPNPKHPERMVSRTFSPKNPDALIKFLDEHQGTFNIYWNTNPSKVLNKKALEIDVIAVHYLHCDCDPRVGETTAELIERIEKLRKAADLPDPTFRIMSGGGVQYFWKLIKPVELNGDLAAIEDVKLRNKHIMQMIDGDKCFSLDHIMRLPGTINVPDQRKKDKGRVPALAYVLESTPEREYPLDLFPKAKDDAPDRPASSGRAPAAIDTSNIVRLGNVNELDKYGVPDDIKVICNVGNHPDKPKEGDNSRSQWVFHAVCGLKRAGVPNEVILSILTDAEFGISESILEKGSGAHRYALRQIERAEAELKENDWEEDKNKKRRNSVTNMRLALHKLGVTFSYNEFSGEASVEGWPGAKFLDDNTMIAIRYKIEKDYLFLPDITTFEHLARSIALENKFHPLKEYLLGLKWDGVSRIDKWLVAYGGAEDTPYVCAVGLCWITAAVRRPLQPGVKFDEILVLESPQGKNKSTAIKLLADEYYGDTVPLGADSKKIIEQTQGVWINEAAELHGYSKTKVEQFKSFLSRQADVARMSYGRLPTKVPRQSVFIGTTNSKHYLSDPTGNRRVWPVKINQFDLEALKRDRDQLWAEAVVREATGVSIHLPEELWAAAAVEQEARVEQHPFGETFEDALGSMRGKFKCTDAWVILNLPPSAQSQPNLNAIGTSLRLLGWERHKRRVDGEQRWYYCKGAQPERLIDVKRDTGLGHQLTLKYREHHEEKFVQEEGPF